MALFSVLVFCLTAVDHKDPDNNTVIITGFNLSSAMYLFSVLEELDFSDFHL